MSTHDYVIDNQSAPAFRSDLNSALAAIVTQNASSSAPSVTYANMLWYDTTNNQLKKRNEANSGWVTLGTIDEGAGTFTPSGAVTLPSQSQTVWDTGVSTTESSLTAAKLHEKLTKMGNGTSGQPRIAGVALKFRAVIGHQGTGYATSVTFTNIDTRTNIQKLNFYHTSASGGYARVRFSTDNGSTWGSYYTIIASGGAAGMYTLVINRSTGNITCMGPGGRTADNSVFPSTANAINLDTEGTTGLGYADLITEDGVV